MVKLLSLLSSQGNSFDNLITNKAVMTAVVQNLTYVTYLTYHMVVIMNRCINANVGFETMISFTNFIKVSYI